MPYTSDIDFVDHDYSGSHWIGVVVNNADPTFSGRCQVKVLGIMDNISNEHLPWAVPISSSIFAGNGAGSISIPKVGQFLRIQFNNGDLYAPEYTAIQNIDTELIQRIRDDYEGTHVLLYDPDEELTIIYQKANGIQIYHKESIIHISADSIITLSTPKNQSIIQMNDDVTNITTTNEIKIDAASYVEVAASEVKVIGSQKTKIGRPPYQTGVGGEALIALLSTLASSVDNKMPSTPGVNVAIVEAAKSTILSSNVLIGI